MKFTTVKPLDSRENGSILVSMAKLIPSRKAKALTTSTKKLDSSLRETVAITNPVISNHSAQASNTIIASTGCMSIYFESARRRSLPQPQ
ncbi:hypothetical protein ACOSP7_002643 [Xanthoceras sorbifolium]